MTMTVAIIGYGYWGPNLVRNCGEVGGVRVGWIVDPIRERLAAASARYPAAQVSVDYRDALADPAVDAVLIATPVSTHFELGMAALAAGRHVLIEKPMAATADEAAQLVDEALRRQLTLEEHRQIGDVLGAAAHVRHAGRGNSDRIAAQHEIHD